MMNWRIILAALVAIETNTIPVIAQSCLQSAISGDGISSEDLGGIGDFPEDLPTGNQAIVTSYQFQCCGNITAWQTSIFPWRREGVYSIHFQVWRPSSGAGMDGCYSMVGEDTYNTIQLGDQTGGRTLEPASFLSVQPGDAVGFYVSRQDGNNMDEGIQLVLHDGDVGDEVWHFTTANSEGSESESENSDEQDESADERRSILRERACWVAVSAFTNSAPVLNVEMDQYACSGSETVPAVSATTPIQSTTPTAPSSDAMSTDGRAAIPVASDETSPTPATADSTTTSAPPTPTIQESTNATALDNLTAEGTLNASTWIAAVGTITGVGVLVVLVISIPIFVRVVTTRSRGRRPQDVDNNTYVHCEAFRLKKNDTAIHTPPVDDDYDTLEDKHQQLRTEDELIYNKAYATTTVTECRQEAVGDGLIYNQAYIATTPMKTKGQQVGMEDGTKVFFATTPGNSKDQQEDELIYNKAYATTTVTEGRQEAVGDGLIYNQAYVATTPMKTKGQQMHGTKPFLATTPRNSKGQQQEMGEGNKAFVTTTPAKTNFTAPSVDSDHFCTTVKRNHQALNEGLIHDQATLTTMNIPMVTNTCYGIMAGHVPEQQTPEEYDYITV